MVSENFSSKPLHKGVKNYEHIRGETKEEFKKSPKQSKQGQ